MFRVVAGVMQTGNVEFVERNENGEEGCSVEEKEEVEKMRDVMGVEGGKLETALTYR